MSGNAWYDFMRKSQDKKSLDHWYLPFLWHNETHSDTQNLQDIETNQIKMNKNRNY